jgi:hypothetical protein
MMNYDRNLLTSLSHVTFVASQVWNLDQLPVIHAHCAQKVVKDGTTNSPLVFNFQCGGSCMARLTFTDH